MNVLSDILCGSSSLILSSSYNGPLSSHDAHLTKPISKQSIMLSNDKDLHLLETLSNTIPSLVPTPNTTVVENGFFDAESIHVSLNLVNSNYPMQHETDPADFVSSEFSNSIPSWFSKDLMKASEHISSNCCEPEENVPSELLPSVRTENLPMLQLEFPQDINVQNNASSLNSSYMPNNQALLTEPQVYSSADSLLSSFNDMGNYQLPVRSTNRTFNKYNQNHVTPYSANSTHNMMNNILPLDNHLDINSQDQINLSLPNSIVDNHNLTNTNAIIADNQNGINSLESLRDKRTNISLNQLDFLLDSHSPLNDMHITSNNFSVSTISADKQMCSDFTREPSVETCNGNLTVMSCNNGSLSNLNIQPFNEPQEMVAMNKLPQFTIDSDINTIIDPVDAAIEEIKCLKCKYCMFLSLNKEQIRGHIRQAHTELLNPSHAAAPNVLYSPNIPPPVQNYNITSLPNGNIISEQNSNNMNSTNFVKKFSCNLCALTFDNSENLNTHILAAHKDRSKSSNVLSNKPMHPTINGIPSVNTNLNNLSRTAEQEINTYISTVTSNANIISSDVNTLPNDQLKNKPNNNKNKKIIQPDEISSQKRSLVHRKAWQKKIRRELSSYICEFKGCNIRFHFLDNLEYHKKCHINGTGKFSCPECTTIFDHWGPTAGHLWRNHSIDMELHACDICPFRTYSLSRLEIIHKPLHQNKFPLQCEVCKKNFKTNKQLRMHKATHFKKTIPLPRKFSCFICSRQFTTKKVLRSHLMVHNKQKSFVCNICDYSASKISTLKMHALQHTGEKPFKCPDCDYQTADHNSFRRHKMKHTGERPYKCPFCPYASIQSATYKVHIKKQHPGQEHQVMFSCNICSFRSVKQENYITHMADHEIEKVSRQDTTNNRLVPDSQGLQQDSEVLPLVAAMDISLFHGDQSMPFNKDNNSYFRQFNINNIHQ